MTEKITAADAIRLLDTGKAVAVDVREPDEYAVGHIPGAKLLPLGEGDMDYSAIRAFLANRAPAAPLLRDEVILPADTADVRYLRRMTDTV